MYNSIFCQCYILNFLSITEMTQNTMVEKLAKDCRILKNKYRQCHNLSQSV